MNHFSDSVRYWLSTFNKPHNPHANIPLESINKLKEKNMTRNEARKAAIDGHKISHDKYPPNSYVFFDGRLNEFIYYSSKVGTQGAGVALTRYEGYYTYHEPLTFERIKRECVPGETLFFDYRCEHDYLYIGFNRRGELVTDLSDGARAESWGEGEVRYWNIVK